MNRLPFKSAGVQSKFWVVACLAVCLALRSSAGTSNTWVNTAGGTCNWNVDANWNPATFPNGVDAVANFETALPGLALGFALNGIEVEPAEVEEHIGFEALPVAVTA